MGVKAREKYDSRTRRMREEKGWRQDTTQGGYKKRRGRCVCGGYRGSL